MSKILLVTSSLFGENSKSSAVALQFVNAWRAVHGGSTLTVRDANVIPHLNGEILSALATAPGQRNPAQETAATSADALIEEVEAADTIVIAAPMYNFSISSPLKAWIDHIVRAGRTFRYTASGPEGLLKGKKVVVVVSRGGVYSGDSPAKGMDFQEPYLRAVLGFLGLSDVTFIHAEGQNISPEMAAQGMKAAHNAIAKIVPTRMAA